MTSQQFQFGDRVVHASRPEWGIGVVTGVQPATHEGAPCQRLSLRFERGGLKTLLTAAADLRAAGAAEEAGAAPESESGEAGGWLGRLEQTKPEEQAARLPESTRDPFASLTSRLKATAALYRFTEQGASLLDWAAAQLGLKDPLSRFTRHELEQLFKRFVFERDAHLKRLVLEARKSQPGALEEVLASAPPEAKTALRRLNAER